MGLFGKKGTTDLTGDAIYVDMEEANVGLPIAVAVPDPPSQEKSPNSVVKEFRQQRYPSSSLGKSAVSTLPTIVLHSRSPTLLHLCPSCRQRNVRTSTRTEPDIVTWMAVVALACLFWPLCWIPLVTDACKRTHHFCQSCNTEIGMIRPFQDCCVKHR